MHNENSFEGRYYYYIFFSISNCTVHQNVCNTLKKATLKIYRLYGINSQKWLFRWGHRLPGDLKTYCYRERGCPTCRSSVLATLVCLYMKRILLHVQFSLQVNFSAELLFFAQNICANNKIYKISYKVFKILIVIKKKH